MLKNYILIAWRNFVKNRTFSLINTVGLALGMICSLLIMLWVRDERSIDAFHVNRERLFSVYERQYYDGTISAYHITPGVLAEEMKKVLPEVKYACGLVDNDQLTFSANDKILKFKGAFAGKDFFKMFSFPLLEGKAETALASPVDIAISNKMAVAFFGSAQHAIGKTLRYENERDLKVTAVFQDIPQNSSIKAEYFTNWDLFLDQNSWAKEWGNNGPKTMILLKETANPVAFEKKITKFLDNYNKDQSKSFYIQLGIQRFDETYLYSTFKEGKIAGGRIEYVRLFSIVAIFILLIACINFMNLTTARSIKRSKEIGIRKVVGAVRPSLIKQFLGEAVLITLLALVVALIGVSLLLPLFNDITSKQITFPYADVSFWLTILLLTIFTGLVAGSYPALFLSAFEPIRVLKGQLKFGKGATWFRKGLVVFQFVLSTVLIVGTIVVSNQIEYVSTTNLGYNRQNLIYIPFEGNLTGKYKLVKEQALKMPGIAFVTRMTNNPTLLENGTGGVDWEGKDPNVTPMFTQASVGYDFLKTTDIRLVAGRDFKRELASDSASYIINESAKAKMSYKDPVGKPLTFWGKPGRIIGVMKDFHFNSLHLPINPLIVRLRENESWGTLIVRTQPGKTKEALSSLEKLCKQYNPQFPFTYDFADEEYKKLYLAEQTISRLSGYFAFLAIFISCLGLLGLTIFTAEQRIRELGIRKVLGASVSSLLTLLSKDFLALVAIALVIAFPIAWWMMNKWLENFTYRENISAGVFILAAAISLLIALATICIHGLKAAMTNPVKSLRTE